MDSRRYNPAAAHHASGRELRFRSQYDNSNGDDIAGGDDVDVDHEIRSPLPVLTPPLGLRVMEDDSIITSLVLARFGRDITKTSVETRLT